MKDLLFDVIGGDGNALIFLENRARESTVEGTVLVSFSYSAMNSFLNIKDAKI